LKRITRLIHRLVQLLNCDLAVSNLAVRTPSLRKFLPLSQEYQPNEIRIVARDGVKFRLDISDYMQWALFSHLPDYSWRYCLGEKIQREQIILDVGANVGHFCLKVAKHLVKHGKEFRVHAFEPNPYVHFDLNENLRLNGDLREVVLVHDVAVGNHDGPVGFSFNRTNSGGGRVTDVPKLSDEITKMIKLDSWVKDNIKNGCRISFLKIDVEGFEPDVLLGASETIQEHKPSLYLEMTDEWFKRRGFSNEWVFKLILSWGYEIFIDMDGQLAKYENDFKHTHAPQFNILAKPIIS
jgi:FkbM family methyltransferase